ncbi:MAG TPA: oxaloacetate decarboxylase subunit gamma [Syntrophomonas sp.]|nr:oxaloacetate decarboxylase subunit gamma [Syntrophomonas sp.]HRW13287.1 oxaloacetate decarboxylase subunit gamma [Syntrophomonas sp.]
MSLPLYTFVAGITGVFLTMILLQVFITLSSKLAIYIESKTTIQEK